MGGPQVATLGEAGGVMPRRLRVQFEGAIDHAMSRGNGRQDIVFNDRDRGHFVDLLGARVGRSAWELISFVLLSSHFHAHYDLSPADLSRRGDHARPRAVAAWLGRRSSSVWLAELCRALGYARPRASRESSAGSRTGAPAIPDLPGTWPRSRTGCGLATIAGEIRFGR